MSTINYQYIADRIPIEILQPLMTSLDSSDIDESLIDEFISDADAEVDNALAHRYVYPYEKVNDELGEKAYSLIRRWKFIIVRQLIYSRKYDNEEMKEVNAHHAAVLSRLSQVRKGDSDIVGLVKKALSPSKLIKSRSNKQVFTQKKLKSYDS